MGNIVSEVIIAKYVRSPFTPAKKGLLKDIRADDLASQTIKKMLENVSLEKKDIEDVIIGCANGEGEQGLNVARVISFLAGLPISSGATTVNRLCASSMTAIHNAAGAIALNSGNVWPKKGILKYPGKITVSFLNPIKPGINKEDFVKNLEKAIYDEISNIS